MNIVCRFSLFFLLYQAFLLPFYLSADEIIDNIVLEQIADQISENSVRLIIDDNILMNDSVSSAIGNIVKKGVRFIHNFGTNNTCIGIRAGNFTTMTGNGNVALGTNALRRDKTGSNNAAIGVDTLTNNTRGSGNIGTGASALQNNTRGSDNTAIGIVALVNNISGNSNVAIGRAALSQNTTGSRNTALGFSAGLNATESDNIFIGSEAGKNVRAGSKNIYIGNHGDAKEVGVIRIGTQSIHKICFIQGIFDNTSPQSMPLYINSAGKLGTQTSSQRFKHNIQPLTYESEALFHIQPVSFIYNNDENQMKQYGLVAEDVDMTFTHLVIKDENGDPHTVRYEKIPVLLLNEMKKLNKEILSQKENLHIQKHTLLLQKYKINELTQVFAQLQKEIEDLQD